MRVFRAGLSAVIGRLYEVPWIPQIDDSIVDWDTWQCRLCPGGAVVSRAAHLQSVS